MLKRRNSKIIAIFLIILLMCGCKKEMTDALKFKEEYENLNGEKYSVNINENNPFKYSTEEEIDTFKKDKKTFVVFYANELDDESRKMAESIVDSSKKNSLSNVYYIRTESIDDVLVPQLLGFIDGEISVGVNSGDVDRVIAPIAEELNTCDVHGC